MTALRLIHLLLVLPFIQSDCYVILAKGMNLSCFKFLSRNIKHRTSVSSHI